MSEYQYYEFRAIDKPLNKAAMTALRRITSRFDTSKGTIRFQPDDPLPASLVRKLVKARIAENGA